MRFLYKERKLVLWRQGLFFSFLCECVPCSYDATAAKSPLFEVNSIQFGGKEKFNLLSLVYVFQKKNPLCTNSRKELRRNCSPIGHNNTKHFCAQSGAGIPLNFWKSLVRVGTQGLFRPYLKTFVAPFLPTRLTALGLRGWNWCITFHDTQWASFLIRSHGQWPWRYTHKISGRSTLNGRERKAIKNGPFCNSIRRL